MKPMNSSMVILNTNENNNHIMIRENLVKYYLIKCSKMKIGKNQLFNTKIKKI